MSPLEVKIDNSWWRVTQLDTPHKDFKVERHTKGVGWNVIMEPAVLRDDDTLFHDNSMDEEVIQCIEEAIGAYLEHESTLAGFIGGCNLGRVVDRRALEALELIYRLGNTDGSHHKQWCLDQVVRILTGENYGDFVAWACAGEDGSYTYDWDEGTPP